MDSVKEGIRLNLIELLERTGKRRLDLAKACGVGKSAVSNWVSGDSSIDVERIPSICEFFGITVDEFFGRSQELEPAPDLTPDERELIECFRATTDFGRMAILRNATMYRDEMPRDDSVETIVIDGNSTDEEIEDAMRRSNDGDNVSVVIHVESGEPHD